MSLTRRLFLRLAGLVGLGATAGLAACGGDAGESSQAKQTIDRAKAAAQDAARCTDLSELTEAQKQLRDSFGYVDLSDDPDLVCIGCEFWTEPPYGGVCGGCTLMAGPIHPQGFCDSYAEA
jgi:hypothetical protein